MKAIELLAPARNLEHGIAALEHGADAVYIGARAYGARSAAGNSTADIAELCHRAHLWGARVYATLNTIVGDDELAHVRQLVSELDEAGVDAVLIQDIAVAELVREKHTHMVLHASTQTDNRNAAKVAWLRDRGFNRVVLARELTIDEIRAIHNAVPDIELEAFVHGALCVSYSGACSASWHTFGRSANRGNCAQFCRMRFDLLDSNDSTIMRDKHLLSLKDMCRLDNLEELIDAGVTSLKIEGRLKNISYVKNIVAAYSKKLDSIIAAHPDKYCRASNGHIKLNFEPEPSKTFSRGYTDYFLHGRTRNMAQHDTPKAMGEHVGRTKIVEHRRLKVAGVKPFEAGDGLCFINADGQMEGFRVNKVENGWLYPYKMPAGLIKNMELWRNIDHRFETIMARPTAIRKIGVTLTLGYKDNELTLNMVDDYGHSHTERMSFKADDALKPQSDNMRHQLSKLGGTPYEASQIVIDASVENKFVPSSSLSELRRRTVEAFERKATHRPSDIMPRPDSGKPTKATAAELHTDNVANRIAREIYATVGPVDTPDALETSASTAGSARPIMTCRYCLRYELGFCTRNNGAKAPWKEPLYLAMSDNRRFRISFDCKRCEMQIYPEEIKHKP